MPPILTAGQRREQSGWTGAELFPTVPEYAGEPRGVGRWQPSRRDWFAPILMIIFIRKSGLAPGAEKIGGMGDLVSLR